MQKEQPKLSVTVRKGDGPQAPTLNLILPSAPTNDIIDTCQKLCGKEINVQRIEPHKEK